MTGYSLQPSVAIVEDDVDLVKSYEMIFRKYQVPVAFATYDGRSALDMFREAEARPRLLLVDHRMPGMSGIELTREIKKIEPCAKVILISADNDVREDAPDAGADAFLKKPVSLRVLLDATRSLIE